jgi:hypothetical protein
VPEVNIQTPSFTKGFSPIFANRKNSGNYGVAGIQKKEAANKS